MINHCFGNFPYWEAEGSRGRGQVDQRVSFRFPADLEADCRAFGHSWTSRLCNISTHGCMIVCPPDDLATGALLRLRLRGAEVIDGEIVWQHRRHAGVRFHAPLDAAVMEHLGFRLEEPAGESARAVDQRQQPAREPTGLHANLIKRTWQDNRDSPASVASAR